VLWLIAGLQSAKVVADAGLPVHFVEARVAWYDEAIGLVEDAKAGAKVGAVS